MLRNQGMEVRYRNELVGFNARMTDIGAAIGRVQLAELPRWNEARRRNAAALDAGLGDLPGVRIPRRAPGAEHVYHQYTIRCRRRDQVKDRLREDGIGADVYYPTPIHRLPAFDLDLDLPVTAEAAAEVLSLPVHPALSGEDVAHVIAGVARAVEA